MLFFIKFQIPWIWRWSLIVARDRLNIPVLQRIFFYKWWSKMNTEDVQTLIKNVENTIKEDQINKDKEQSSQPNPLAQMKSYFQRKYPNETENQIMLRTMEYMKQQFCSTFSTTQIPKDDTMSTSSQGSFKSNLAGESQPDYELNPEDIEDIFETMIQTVDSKGQKDKGHIK
jgi:hypothetical protein